MATSLWWVWYRYMFSYLEKYLYLRTWFETTSNRINSDLICQLPTASSVGGNECRMWVYCLGFERQMIKSIFDKDSADVFLFGENWDVFVCQYEVAWRFSFGNKDAKLPWENSGETTFVSLAKWVLAVMRWTGSFSRDKEASPGAAEKADMSPAVWCWCVTV